MSSSPREPSPSASLRAKRPLSSPAPSTSLLKRANSEDLMQDVSDNEGSLGASRLNIASTPRSRSSSEDADVGDDTLVAPPSPPAAADSPPAYEETDGADVDSSNDDEPAGYQGPAAENQLSAIRELKNAPLEEGDDWYIVSRAWYRRWQTAVSGVAAEKGQEEGLNPEEVGPINNTSLAGEDGELRKNPPVQEGVDIELLPAPAWGMLKSWYGLVGPEISRTVVATAGFGSETIEFYPPSFQFFLLLPTSSSSSAPIPVPSLDHAPSTSLPSTSPFSALLSFATTSFSLHPSRPVRLWRLPPIGDTLSAHEGPAYVFADKLRESGVELLENVEKDSSLVDALLSDPETRLAVEQQDQLGNWIVDAEAILRTFSNEQQQPEEGAASSTPPAAGSTATTTAEEAPKSKKGLFSHGWHHSLHHKKSKDTVASTSTTVTAPKASGSSSSSGAGLLSQAAGLLTRSRTQAAGGGAKGQRGLVGLQNLGNTCFMNSALQCMSNTKELNEYFLSGVYKSELNPDNPLGMRGQVAEALALLIDRLWNGSSTSYAPREFKQALSRFAPQFSGYGQQDSQELLAFLLDGTHEDLNRIKKKPGTEAPDWEGGGDRELVEMAKTCWEQYRSRNDSVIVDLFQGQYRSTVVCPDCDKVSITFDPFMYVTTNLPVTKKWTGKVFVVPLDNARSVLSVECEVPKSGTIKTLKSIVGKLVDIDPKRLIMTEVFHHKFWKEWNDDEAIIEVNAAQDTLIFHETTLPFPQPRPRNNNFNMFPRGSRSSTPAPSAVDPDAPVHIVVAHKVAPKGIATSSARQMYGTSSGRNSSDLFGSPFVLTLTADEACDEKAIRRKIARQYARTTREGDELIQLVEEEMAERERDAIAVCQPPAPVVPIVVNGSAAMDVDAAQSSAAPPTASLNPFIDSSISSTTLDASAEASTSTSTSSLTSTEPSTISSSSSIADADESPSARRRVLAPYRIDIVKRPNPSGRLPLGQLSYDDPADPLENKAEVVRKLMASQREKGKGKEVGQGEEAEREKKEEDVDMFSPGPSGGAVEEIKVGEEQPKAEATAPVAVSAAVEDKEETEDVSPPPRPLPLVKTGHYLVVHWDPQAHSYFFDAASDAWDDVEQVVEPSILAKRAEGKGGAKKVITLADCLTEFTKEERLGEDDMWYCGNCKEHKQATKKVELWKVPDVLVFALKRFSSSRYSRDKIDDFVDFPFDLDMEPFVESDRVEKRLAEQLGADGLPIISEPDSLNYELYAVSNHFGGLGGGHYTAFAKNHESGKWYDFDDSRVSEVSSDRVRTPAAYLLFYRRRTARPIGGRQTHDLIESANASRNNSAAPSIAGSVGHPSPTLHPSSRLGNNATVFVSASNNSSSASDDDNNSLFGRNFQSNSIVGDTDDEDAAMPGAFNGSTSQRKSGGGFSGFFPPPSASVNPLPSPAYSAEPGSPKDFSQFEDVDDAWTANSGAEDLSLPSLEVAGGDFEDEREVENVLGVHVGAPFLGGAVEPPAQEIRLEGEKGSVLEKLD